MLRPFSFAASPERSRLRGWLEGTVAGLCELQLLRERQERRVRHALRLLAHDSPAGQGDDAAGAEPAPEDQLVRREGKAPAHCPRPAGLALGGWEESQGGGDSRAPPPFPQWGAP